MTTPSRTDALRHSIAAAAERLASRPTPETARPGRPAPGDLYVLGVAEDAPTEWLVVREHPDDPGLVLLAPSDDFPLAGVADVVLPADLVGRPLVVRCGEACWVPVAACPEHLRVGTLPDDAVRLVRRHLAAVARGEMPAAADRGRADEDPEYAAWMGSVARTREAVQLRADAGVTNGGTVIPVERFAPTPPAAWAAEPELTLAASPGGLLAGIGRALAAVGPRYQEVEVASGGRLLLTADADGVRVTWIGTSGATPPPLSAVGPTGRLVATWQPGSQPGYQHAAELFPWVDGQVAFTAGGEVPQSWTVRL